jgi:hypothetical protein
MMTHRPWDFFIFNPFLFNILIIIAPKEICGFDLFGHAKICGFDLFGRASGADVTK